LKKPDLPGKMMTDTAAMLRNAYKNRRVLVTGHTGFKGSWLSLWLEELGADVAGYALDPDAPKGPFVLSGLPDSIADVRADIRDYDALKRTFDKYMPDFVFHLAAQPLVREGYRDPKETYDVNIGGTVNVLEACRTSPSVKVVINVTSDKCYENKERMRGYRETDPLGGHDPYSSSKACSEIVTTAWRKSFFSPETHKSHGKALSSARAGNVIGGGDWAKDRILPDCVRALEDRKPIEVRNPHAVRPWQHVLEALGGYLLLGARMARSPRKYSGAWNFGPALPSAISVQRLVELAIDSWGEGTWRHLKEKTKPHEAGLLTLDTRKARTELGWKPCLDTEQAVRDSIAWYKAADAGRDMGELCRRQILDYMEKMRIQ
jgi:CDP-glucose 4,6-dehydratase